MKYRNAYELEDGRIHAEIYDEDFDDWAEWVVDPNDEPTRELWEAIKEKGGYTPFVDWQKETEALRAAQAETELMVFRIETLKRYLQETDYQAIKYAEGEMTAEEYEPMKELRRKWRAEINELENILTGEGQE